MCLIRHETYRCKCIGKFYTGSEDRCLHALAVMPLMGYHSWDIRPGEKRDYCCTDHCCAVEIMKKVPGMTYEDALTLPQTPATEIEGLPHTARVCAFWTHFMCPVFQNIDEFHALMEREKVEEKAKMLEKSNADEEGSVGMDSLMEELAQMLEHSSADGDGSVGMDESHALMEKKKAEEKAKMLEDSSAKSEGSASMDESE